MIFVVHIFKNICIFSVKHPKPGACQGPPMAIRADHKEDISINYTYSVSFLVS